jgi:hypothetical protein
MSHELGGKTDATNPAETKMKGVVQKEGSATVTYDTPLDTTKINITPPSSMVIDLSSHQLLTAHIS